MKIMSIGETDLFHADCTRPPAHPACLTRDPR